MAVPALLTAQTCSGHVHLIIGSNSLAASRCSNSLRVGAVPVIIAEEDADLHFSLRNLIEDGKVHWTRRAFEEEDLRRFGREEIDFYPDAVFVTLDAKSPLSLRISNLCKRLRIPVNVVDAPKLCTFTLLTTYSDGPLQIGITTSGRGCKLSSRIRREISAALPPNFGDAIEKLGTIRRKIWEEDNNLQQTSPLDPTEADDDESPNQKHTFNTLVYGKDDDPIIARTRRMRWLSQICEYWPLTRLASISEEDVASILVAYRRSSQSEGAERRPELRPSLSVGHRKGTVTLAGSGPGHPSMLTMATHDAIKTAHYILADKLVPAEVLNLIPRRTPVHIAKKYPGNADAAQDELHALALVALKEGKDVLRLKQGDPYLYGRGAEEVIFFREHGFEARVIPGITSSLSGPLFAGIPPTHRSVADEVVICTGTGRKGAAPDPPAYKSSRTVVFLMALHRLENLVQSLTVPSAEHEAETQTTRILWPRDTPVAVVERASCPDQRVIRSTLEHVGQAVEEEGSRPPGLLVLGWACQVLHKPQQGLRWSVEEGFKGLDGLGDIDTINLNLLRDATISEMQKEQISAT